ncbi:MAG TPA: methylated-DNA--[protein]-cysteine S-methyltransferase [Solirubrobacteraceae bacterium]|nr:methylated-DNA--[protein]-cysteine S-methyltransferase [Solirubrobacteraceae bacterium]
MSATAHAAIRIGALQSPIGELLVACTDRGVVRVAYPDEPREDVIVEVGERISPEIEEAPVPEEVRRQLSSYFSGSLRRFSLPLDRTLIDGAFTREVLRETEAIPYGRTTSYADIAAAAGSPRGSRAAGNALGTNPLPVLIPCHRVVRACGALGGYGGGLHIKRALLALEGAI